MNFSIVNLNIIIMWALWDLLFFILVGNIGA